MIFAWGKWRVELRWSKPLVDFYVQWPKAWGAWREVA